MLSRQLAESGVHLQLIFDHMTEGIVVLDRDGEIVLMNNAAARLLNIPEGPGAYQRVVDQFESFTPEGIPVPPGQWPTVRALRGEFVQNFEIMYRNKSTGETGARQISTAPITNDAGDFVQVIVSYRDITEQHKLVEARTRLAAIVESSDDAIIGKDANGIISSWNEGAEKIFGYSAAEMLGQSIKRLLPDREHEEDQIMQQVLSDRQVDHFNTVRCRKDGKLIHVSLSISPIKNVTGKIIGASKIARDITAQRNLERQLIASQKMDAIGQLTGGIAHDFNNLLGIIVGNLDLLERFISTNPDALKRLAAAQKATTRGADLTRRLLAFSSSQELNPAPTPLNESIQTMIELASRVLGPEIKITTHLAPSHPIVLADAPGLESALLNLLVNARDAMPSGGALTITTRLSELDINYAPVQAGDLKPGLYACISVSDTGHGMSPQTLERALEPFFTTKPRGKGTGLGLPTVYGFAKQSGGTLRLYSELGFGTTVSLYLPLAERRVDPVRPAPEEAVQSQRSGVVLVVDDEIELLEIALIYLTEMGYTALHAKDGKSALEVIAQHPETDLVITDVIMPGGMSGVELAQKIRQQNQFIKIAYSSGFPADALAEKSVTPIDGPILRKPYLRTEFAAVVHTAMNSVNGSSNPAESIPQ